MKSSDGHAMDMTVGEGVALRCTEWVHEGTEASSFLHRTERFTNTRVLTQGSSIHTQTLLTAPAGTY